MKQESDRHHKFTDIYHITKNTDETYLLTIIQDNSKLPETQQQRYRELWQKCEDETLNETEHAEYQTLISELDSRNLKRIEALIVLANLRGKTIDEVIADIGVNEENSAC